MHSMIQTANATHVRNNFRSVLRHVRSTRKPLVITERGKATIVLVDIDEFEDYLTAKDPKLVVSIKKARAQYKKGQVVDMSDVFEDIE